MLPRVQIARSISASVFSARLSPSFSNYFLRRNFSAKSSLNMPSAQVFNTNDGAIYTTSSGAPAETPYASQRTHEFGPLLLQGMYPTVFCRYIIY